MKNKSIDLTKKVIVRNITSVPVYISLFNCQTIYIPEYGFVWMYPAEIMYQVFDDENRFFIGPDPKRPGWHASLYVQSKKLRKYLGFGSKQTVTDMYKICCIFKEPDIKGFKRALDEAMETIYDRLLLAVAVGDIDNGDERMEIAKMYLADKYILCQHALERV